MRAYADNIIPISTVARPVTEALTAMIKVPWQQTCQPAHQKWRRTAEQRHKKPFAVLTGIQCSSPENWPHQGWTLAYVSTYVLSCFSIKKVRRAEHPSYHPIKQYFSGLTPQVSTAHFFKQSLFGISRPTHEFLKPAETQSRFPLLSSYIRILRVKFHFT